MKNKTTFLCCSAAALALLSSCNVNMVSEKTPKSSFYNYIEKNKTINGFPKTEAPWIVLSDRSNNSAYMDKGNEKSPKDIKFLEPLLIVGYKKEKKMMKVAEYIPDALMKKIDKKSIKTYGWVPENQLLLWTNALKNSDNGFTFKASLVPNNIEVIKDPAKYIKNDSILVFDAPDLAIPKKRKLPIGQLVYIYKQDEFNKRYLIGKNPSIKLDSIQQNIYGWVSSNVVSYWGERTAIKMKPTNITPETSKNIGVFDAAEGTNKIAVSYNDILYRNTLENVYPIPLNKELTAFHNSTKYNTNIFDYSKNSVYNVLGEPISFDRYKEIIRSNKKLNIVFTIDISRENSQNTAIAKSLFQDVQVIDKLNYYKNIKYGVVLFKNNTCGDNIATSELSSDFNKIPEFIDESLMRMRCEGSGGQPLQDGLAAAGEMLSTVPDETNIVICIGSTASGNYGLGNPIRSLSQARARMIIFQTASRYPQEYTNFVLAAENVVTNTAKNISKLKMEKIVDQNEVTNKNNYSLLAGEQGLFSLDYPNTSMTQGFVIYPNKGETSANKLLAKSLDSLISQVTLENVNIDTSLTKYFKSKLGSSKTELKQEYRYLYPETPTPVPYEISSQLISYENPFLIKGKISEDFKNDIENSEKGILISDTEFDELRDFYLKVYNETEPLSTTFSRSSATQKFINLVKQSLQESNKVNNSTLKSKPMAYAIGLSTGFNPTNDDLLNKYTLKDWKNNKLIDNESVRTYFKNYKILADRLLDNKNNAKIKIQQNGAVYYWLNDYYMPSVNLSEKR